MLLFLIFTYLLLISFPTSPEFYSTRCFSFTVLPIITLHIVDSIANSSLPSLLAPISHKRRSCLATWSEEHGRRSLKRVAIHNLQKTRIYKIPPKRERERERERESHGNTANPLILKHLEACSPSKSTYPYTPSQTPPTNPSPSPPPP